VVDLTQPVRDGMPVFPGDPGVTVAAAAAVPPWRVSALTLGSHAGTHVDAPAHFLPGGSTLDAFPPQRFVVEALVVRVAAGDDAELGPGVLAGLDAAGLAGRAVFFHTGWDRHFGEPRALHHPYLGEALCEALVGAGVGMVGTDALNVDATAEATTHAHAVLLGAGVLVVENLTNLGGLASAGPHRVVVAPLALQGTDGAPARVFALDDGEGRR
jgi:kynurenine formamidase